jgi:hypothetical protein
MTPPKASLAFRISSVLGAIGLVIWTFVWIVTMRNQALPLGELLWITHPAYGADFWSQSGYAADLWLRGLDPYDVQDHILPYPPLVIRLFTWVGYFSMETSIRIWIVTLGVIAAGGALVAHRTRRQLGLLTLPVSVSVLAVIASHPVIFEMERANCNLITVATILVALPLLGRGGRVAPLLAGAVLAIGPWVKFYPGLLGLGLLALRQWWAFLGFVLGGAAIFLSMPAETMRALTVLDGLMAETRAAVLNEIGVYPPWSHSLSHLWLVFAHEVLREYDVAFFTRLPEVAIAGVVAVGALSPVCVRVFRFRDRASLTYPLLLWICAVASCVPIIANDYSLVFYPLCVVACADPRDSRWAWFGILASLPMWQPFFLPISGWAALVAKMLGLAGVGICLWQRAGEPMRRPTSEEPSQAFGIPIASATPS